MVDWEGNFIWALHVQPTCRRGVGAALLALAEAAMRQAGVREARLETDDFNVRSRAARNGYQEIDTYPDEEWDSGFTTVLLSKRLAD